MGVAYITRVITIQGTCGYRFFECAIKYMGVIRQNPPSSIMASPSGGNSQQQ